MSRVICGSSSQTRTRFAGCGASLNSLPPATPREIDTTARGFRQSSEVIRAARSIERLPHIRDEVFRVLDPDRETDEPGRDPELRELLGRDPLVRGEQRQRDERLDRPEGGRAAEDADGIEEALRLLER